MNILELIRMIVFNLLRMKVRALMTALGVVIGTASVVLLVSLGVGLQESAIKSMSSSNDLTEMRLTPNLDVQSALSASTDPEAATDFTLNQAQFTPKIKQAALDELNALPGVKGVAPTLNLQNSFRLRLNRLDGFAQEMVGVDPDLFDSLGYELESGNAELGPGQIVVGAEVGRLFFDASARRQPARPGAAGSAAAANAPAISTPEPQPLQDQRIQFMGNKIGPDRRPVQQQWTFLVAGVLKKTGSSQDRMIYLPVREVIEMNTWQSGTRANPEQDGYNQAIMRVNSPQDAQRLETILLEMGYTVQSPISIIRQLNQSFRIIQIVLSAIGGIALLVAGFGIANTMMMAIYERSREIGLMKAVGATNRDVMFMFLGEAGLIGLIGGVVGNLIALATGAVLSVIISQFLGQGTATTAGAASTPSASFSVITPVWLLITGTLFSILIGVVAGLYPALRTTQLDPILALKTE